MYELHRISPCPRGYHKVRAPEGYPGKKYVGLYTYEHLAVYWLYNGELPPPEHHVHHIDGDHTNNHPLNLVAVHRRDHSKHFHNGGKHEEPWVELDCAYCHKKFSNLERSVRYRQSLGQKDFFCTKSCQVTLSNANRKGIKLNYPKNRKPRALKGYTLNCKVCSKEFYVRPCYKDTAKTCSLECSYQYKTIQAIERKREWLVSL